jgi:hypothetical protein
MKTTLNAIQARSLCHDSWKNLLAHLGKTKGDDEPLDLLVVLNVIGLDQALLCLQTIQGHDAAIRKLACDFALSVAHLWSMPDITRQYLETQDEIIKAAALDAGAEATARYTRDSALDAAWAAEAAAEAAAGYTWDAWVAIGYAAETAAWSAAEAAAKAAAETAAGDAAGYAAWSAERHKQERLLRTMLEANP